MKLLHEENCILPWWHKPFDRNANWKLYQKEELFQVVLRKSMVLFFFMSLLSKFKLQMNEDIGHMLCKELNLWTKEDF